MKIDNFIPKSVPGHRDDDVDGDWTEMLVTGGGGKWRGRGVSLNIKTEKGLM